MKPKIIVVSGDQDEEELMAEILRKSGVGEVFSATPQKVVTAPHLEDVGLVLLDQRLDHAWTGLMISHHLRESHFQAPIVIMAAPSHKIDPEFFPNDTDFLEKPFGIDELIQKVKQKLGPDGSA